MESLIQFDAQLFSAINGLYLPKSLDLLLTLFRNELFWIPVYTSIIAFFVFNYRFKFYIPLIACLLTTAVSDFTSSTLIKKSVKRERPCNADINMIERVPCGHGYSFTSSHAANHFALSTFLFLVFGSILTWRKWILLAWPTLISFCQIYVGKHYPLDILFGTLLGLLIGWISYKYFMHKVNFSVSPIY